MMHGFFCVVVGAASGQSDLPYVWKQATPEAKAIIVFLIFFSIIAWSVIGYKVMQMRRAKRLNYYFNEEFRAQKAVMDIFDRKLQVEGCPLYAVYETGCIQLDARLQGTWRRTAQTKCLHQKHGAYQARARKCRGPGIA